MKYREIKKKRDDEREKIEDLKAERFFNGSYADTSILNDEIKKRKFRYKFYNYMLKGEINESKNR